MYIRNPKDKIKTHAQARQWRNRLISEHRKLVLTNGCFDILHRGHMEYLNLARQNGDCLLVAVNNDASVRKLKGPSRPINGENDRAYFLASLEAVDAVILFSDIRATKVLAMLKPDIYVKGGDYTEETLDREEYDILRELECSIKFLKFICGHSTSHIIEKIKKSDL